MRKIELIGLVIALSIWFFLGGCANTKITSDRFRGLEDNIQEIDQRLTAMENRADGLTEATKKNTIRLDQADNIKEVVQTNTTTLREIVSQAEELDGRVTNLSERIKLFHQRLRLKESSPLVNVTADIETEAEKDQPLSKLTERVNALEKKERQYANLQAYIRIIQREIGLLKAASRFGNVYYYLVGPFDSNSWKLNKNIKEQLKNEVLPDLKAKDLRAAGIHSFASQNGLPERNQEVSDQRAKAIADWLKKKGHLLPPNQIKGFGGTTDFGRKKDNQSAIIFAVSAVYLSESASIPPLEFSPISESVPKEKSAPE